MNVAGFPSKPKTPEPHQLLQVVRIESLALAELCGRWAPMLPKPVELAEAEAGFERLRGTLAALRDCMGGAPDAA